MKYLLSLGSVDSDAPILLVDIVVFNFYYSEWNYKFVLHIRINAAESFPSIQVYFRILKAIDFS